MKLKELREKANLRQEEIAKAKEEYKNVVSVIDSACSKGIIDKNNADRKKSRD